MAWIIRVWCTLYSIVHTMTGFMIWVLREELKRKVNKRPIYTDTWPTNQVYSTNKMNHAYSGELNCTVSLLAVVVFVCINVIGWVLNTLFHHEENSMLYMYEQGHYLTCRNSWQKCTCIKVIRNINWFSSNQSLLPGKNVFLNMFFKMIEHTIILKKS